MIKKIKLHVFLRIFYSNYFFVKFNNKKFKLDDLELNFQNINFENIDFLKKIFISAKYINKKDLEKNNYYYHSFDWLISAKKIGGTESINLSKKNIFNWHNFKFSIFSFAWNNEVAS